jgi:hypothetical protein
MPKIVLSHSKIKDYYSCPAKFSYLYLSKRIKFEDTPETIEGKKRHDALEKYCENDGKYLITLPATDQIWADKIRSAKGRKFFEKSFVISEDYLRCFELDRVIKENGFMKFPKVPADALIRGAMDVLIINEPFATIVDWKTGKMPGPGGKTWQDEAKEPLRTGVAQLDVYALATFLLFPGVTQIKGVLVYLQVNATTEKVYLRKDLEQLRGEIKHFYEIVKVVIETNEDWYIEEHYAFPSKLCNWCSAKNICKKAQLG